MLMIRSAQELKEYLETRLAFLKKQHVNKSKDVWHAFGASFAFEQSIAAVQALINHEQQQQECASSELVSTSEKSRDS